MAEVKEESSRKIEENEVDGAVERLMNLDNPDPSDSSAREFFVRDTAMFLLGVGLEAQEIELFEKHGLGLDQILTLTENDLDHIGITCPKKRQDVLNSIEKLQDKSKLPPHSYTDTDFHPDNIQAVTSTARHLQILGQSLPFLRRRMSELRGDCFFRCGVSGPYTLDHLLELCLQQAVDAQQQLQAFVHEFEQEKPAIQRRNKRLSRKKWLLFVVLTGSCAASLVMLGWRKLQDFPGSCSLRLPSVLSK